ncbi:assimilatory sulfite reductase (NADPH) flavoprotein subunit [Hansschlegelia beijingensis]|uniref:Sulfite reductase [NADPH] flavoprotein alpha-component n=1 Tax=Hansschlegelia beijingensis TaxID=1133344 RepID=A0A7W6D6D2_9HYPH|nr:assimilatory sulfite reductase (NADPH) flavoprotein subunit [Hansschlegelia beijingensis]MBB3973963.1 sulfite reductase (NADPH) flavoprotein alpha-component [Hansschlegelia beijingensis]
MSASEFPGPGLSPDQWEHIQSLAKAISPEQALWLSGYFAGVRDAERREAGRPALAPDIPVARPAAAPEADQRRLTILFGSETGNSRALAQALSEAARQVGRQPTVVDIADYKARQLRDEQDLLIVVSTYGEGDPPQGAADFFEFLDSRKAPKLPDLRFAVLALGDSTYERYCEAGKRLDRRLEELGGVRLRPRVDCDVDYDEPAAAWTADVVAKIARKAGRAAAAADAPRGAGAAALYDKRNPFPARVLENLTLTGRGSTKETRHIEFSLEGSGLVYEPGDALGVAPRNDPRLVESLLDALRLSPSAPVEIKGRASTLAEAIEKDLEISAVTPRFIEQWAELSGAEQLRRLLGEDAAAERSAFLRRNHVIDIVRAYPVAGLEAQTLVAGLRPLQPRLYSIASSLAAAPDEAHLTVSTVRYELNGEPRSGVASGHLAARAEPDATLPVYVQSNPHFRLPADDRPVIMIGAGTGVAPYRAFLQEREARGAKGRNWLFFGERNFRSDFLYQTEWQGWLKQKLLTRMDVAFSRDRAAKVYVQDKLRGQARDVFAWLEEGAHVYVCGDAAHLAPDVHETLIGVAQEQGGLAREAAEEYVRNLQRDHRYQRDVY